VEISVCNKKTKQLKDLKKKEDAQENPRSMIHRQREREKAVRAAGRRKSAS